MVDLAWYRDLVIVILCILGSLLVLGWFIIFCILYARISKYSSSANHLLKKTNQGMAYVQGLIKGLNETMSIINRGG